MLSLKRHTPSEQDDSFIAFTVRSLVALPGFLTIGRKSNDLSSKSIDKFRSCFFHVVSDIHSEIDYMFERGTLFEERRGSGRRIQRKAARLRRCQDKDIPHGLVPRPPIADADEIGQVDEEAENGDDGTDPLFEDVEAISLGFYESCFSKAFFNSHSFISDCHSLFQEYENKTDQKTAFLKAKVISNDTRKVFPELSMTRRQMDKLNRLIKAVILCVAPELGGLTEHIHAGYMSCIRDSAGRVAEKETSLDRSFVSCEYFSLAFDTALFGQEHILSCIVRFVFPDKITQLPLFMRTCTSSTGEDLGSFHLQRAA